MSLPSRRADRPWPFVKFRLLVTGKGEERYAADLFRPLCSSGRCSFRVDGTIPQVSPVTSQLRKAKMVRTRQEVPEEDVRRIGYQARRLLSKGKDRRLVILDDLESGRRPTASHVYSRYRTALDTVLSSGDRCRVSVHFFVNMVEAYFLADPQNTNRVLNSSLPNQAKDVESVRNPKGSIKRTCPGYDEIRHGQQVAAAIDMGRVLSDPDTCRALRTMFLWCAQHAGIEATDRFRLKDGALWRVTAGQLPIPVDKDRIQELP